jgi:hypothetical protein
LEERFHDWSEKKPSFVIDTTHCPIEKSVLEKIASKKDNSLHTFKDKKHECYSIKYQYIVSMRKPRICNISPGNKFHKKIN